MSDVKMLIRLTADPQLRKTKGSGKSVLSFQGAINRGKDKNGNERADFPSFIAWEKRAEAIAQYVKKGDRLLVEGDITTHSYEKNGEKRKNTYITVRGITFIESRNRKKESSQGCCGPMDTFGYDFDNIPF